MTVTVHAMTCGWLTMPTPFLLDNTDGTTRIPIPAYLIRHSRGNVLFDSGMSLKLQREGAAALGELEPYFDIHFEAGEEISARLASLNLAPEDIDYLVSSHLHFDHCGGHGLIPNAGHVVQKREWEAATVPELIEANHYFPDEYDHGHERIEADGEHDLFGDGSVVCIPTHGHTPGHQSLVLETDGGKVVLCGDACYLKQTLDEMRLPAPIGINDEASMRASLEKLKALRSAGARMMYGHDPAFWKTIPQAPASI